MTYVKNRLRRTMMFVPGNNPSMIKDAGIYGADSIMLDLEDAVSLTEKDAARMLVYNAIKTVDFGGAEIVVRINGQDTPFYEEDVKAMVRAGVDVIRLPKTESAAMIQKLVKDMEQAEEEYDIKKDSIGVMAAIESAKGVLNAPEIATATSLMMGLAVSGEDYTADMHTRRYPDGRELEFARNMVLQAARAADVYAFDTVFSNMNDPEGFYRETNYIYELGYDGKSLVNPRQIEMVNKVFNPTKDEIENAMAVQSAIREAKAKGSGVISMNGKMVDKPVVEKANRVIETAKASSLIDEEGNYIGK
ncbi:MULTISPECIES: aldolase/citrate lyase family protein [unclassified Lactobacillus]|uniref:aldolase/citrate lyase family protein n=1 Tax=unclassified Lactobacillus TaxID=2620435 RepID=UPI000EFB037D|nr:MULTISPECIES: aldolase/citrate lyase family protein [unclassified Lactobacillus]RMC40014.1 citrate lyase subunit beta [Lactobacillus sp. ESL0237]RMC44175.1 citrate lyase subunit beta [Lactobacillus sp. ESL0234]RMC45503.1 citrate lyase subunit beta [Lactobacillus sp. ESL0236]RMC50766.1 citrate lyase subunit beta [Lactobacillus sp. ESL0225]